MGSAFGGLVAQLEQYAVRAKEKPMPTAMQQILEVMAQLDRPVSPRELSERVGRTYHNARWWMQRLRIEGYVYYTAPLKGKMSLTNPGGWRLTPK